MIVNRIRFSGNITDQFNNKIDGAKIVWSDSKGIPKKHDDKPVGSYSNEFGEWALQIPSQYFHSEATNFLTARISGQPAETIQIYPQKYKNIDLILGAKTQQEDEVTVIYERTLIEKLKANKKKILIGVVIALALAVVTVLLVRKSK